MVEGVTAQHQVFVIWSNPLFLESLRLLMQNANIRWIGASRRSQEGYASIGDTVPDTILIEEEENGGSIPANIIELLETSATHTRIFRLSLADNDLKIYHREKRTVVQAEDLLNLIRNGE